MAIRVIGRREDPIRKINTHYLLSDGRICTREVIIQMWRQHLLPGYHISKINGIEDLRNNPHTKESDIIDHQPLI